MCLCRCNKETKSLINKNKNYEENYDNVSHYDKSIK